VALNFLQTLSAVATKTRYLVDKIAHTNAQLLDTRKTIPGLRLAQKYAVKCGGGVNHRMGLYDAVMLKENHIIAAGSIGCAIKSAIQKYPNLPLSYRVFDFYPYDRHHSVAIQFECFYLMTKKHFAHIQCHK
jgi:nicotinate-nucleotide pyrophosphorylase (carboxylating)